MAPIRFRDLGITFFPDSLNLITGSIRKRKSQPQAPKVFIVNFTVVEILLCINTPNTPVWYHTV